MRLVSAWWCSWTKWATDAGRKPRAIGCLRPPHQCGWQSAFEVNERKWRLMGALNAQTGRVDTLDNSIVGRKQVIQFLGRLNAAYPQASRISVVLDNWSIHQHPDVQEARASPAAPRPGVVADVCPMAQPD